MKMKKNYNKGFTLVELVVYMGIMSILVGVLGSVFAAIVDVQLESEATASVDQDGRYILSKLLYDMKSASLLTTPSGAGSTSSTLQITVNAIPYIYSLDGSGNLQVVNHYGTNVLNSYDSQISGLSFQRIGTGGSNDTVRVNFTVTSRTLRNTGPESRSFQTTLSRDYRQ
jgi:type II secretory pathway pseudopilin PulG